MTLGHIRDFAKSHAGGIYSAVCERWGVDPAAFMDDPYLAFQLRMALAYAQHKEPEQVDSFAETRARSQELMKQHG